MATERSDQPPVDQAWFWTPQWQAGEAEVDEHVRRGEVVSFASMEDFMADLARGEGTTGQGQPDREGAADWAERATFAEEDFIPAKADPRGPHVGADLLLADLQRQVREGTIAVALSEGRDPAEALKTSLAEELLAERAAEAARETAREAGEGPLALCQRYAAGDLARPDLVEALVAYPYAEVERDPYDDVSPFPPGAWTEVEGAARRGLIDDDIYEEVFHRRHPD